MYIFFLGHPVDMSMLQMLTGDTLFPSQDIEEDLQDEILNMDLDFPDFLENNEVDDYKHFFSQTCEDMPCICPVACRSVGAC